ncbi:hypothetical protein Sgri01_07159 [Streptomyces griseus]
MAPEDQSIAVVAVSACRVRGKVPCRMAMIILIMPPTPAAAWVCPMFDLREPILMGSPSGRPVP